METSGQVANLAQSTICHCCKPEIDAHLLSGCPERDGPAGAAAAEGRGAPRLRALLAQAARLV